PFSVQDFGSAHVPALMHPETGARGHCITVRLGAATPRLTWARAFAPISARTSVWSTRSIGISSGVSLIAAMIVWAPSRSMCRETAKPKMLLFSLTMDHRDNTGPVQRFNCVNNGCNTMIAKKNPKECREIKRHYSALNKSLQRVLT